MTLRILLVPFLRYIAPLFSKKINDRVDFELKNWTEIPLLSQADYGFEISSEGELEQIKIVLLEVLNKGKTVELIYCSPSVESQCRELLDQFPQQLRLYRLPIFCYNPFSKIANPRKWMTCKTLFMCRYDFFPELIKYGKINSKKFVLLAGSLKNYESKNYFVKKYLHYAYRQFDQIITITKQDRANFIDSFDIDPEKLEVYDFRVLQIMDRLLKKEQKIQSKLSISTGLINYLDTIAGKKIIFGSYWAEEL